MIDWMMFNDAVHVKTNERDSMVSEVEKYLKENPDDPYRYSMTGDTIVVGFNTKEGINILDCKVRRETFIENNITNSPENDNEDDIWNDLDKTAIRFRTMKIYKYPVEAREIKMMPNELLGRVTVVTIPLKKENKSLLVDFAFCSVKDKFTRKMGQLIAIEKLKDKAITNQDMYVILKEDNSDIEGNITDAIKNLIVDEYTGKIYWLKGITSENII